MVKSKVSAKAPVISGKQYHIQCASGDVAPFVLVPGDPARVGKIASLWDSSHEIANHREYHTMTGAFQGTPISCTSSGIGGPSLAIAVDELCRIGAHTFIRVGSTGGIQKGQEIGDLVISTGAVRLEVTSKDFVLPEYPAIAHFEVVMALIQAAEELKIRYHVGITASTDTFYTGQGRPAYGKYFPSHKDHIFRDMQAAKVQNFEMEAATLFTMASLFGKRAGAVCCIVANRLTDAFEITDEMQKRAGLVASHAVALLETWDNKKRSGHKQHLFPSLLTR